MPPSLFLRLTLLAFVLALVSGCDPNTGGSRDEVTVPLANRSGPRADDPPILGSRDPRRSLVVIDPGHGGRDLGAVSPHGGGQEKAVTLAIAAALRDELIRTGQTRVALTRSDDRFIPLRERYEIARRLGADLFISVHADAAPLSDVARGATVYTLSEVASDREAALLASGQNRADAIAGVELDQQNAAVNAILIDLAQRESMEVSTDFARLIQREGAGLFPFRPEPHRFAGLVVLKAPDIPSVLFESGYMTNAEDSAYLQSTEGRTRIATGLRRAIEAHFARRRLQLARR